MEEQPDIPPHSVAASVAHHLIPGVLIGIFYFLTREPVVEELYFRGYLLPRTPGKASILWHSLLFAVYHVFTPWMIVTRTIGLLPLIVGLG